MVLTNHFNYCFNASQRQQIVFIFIPGEPGVNQSVQEPCSEHRPMRPYEKLGECFTSSWALFGVKSQDQDELMKYQQSIWLLRVWQIFVGQVFF